MRCWCTGETAQRRPFNIAPASRRSKPIPATVLQRRTSVRTIPPRSDRLLDDRCQVLVCLPQRLAGSGCLFRFTPDERPSAYRLQRLGSCHMLRQRMPARASSSKIYWGIAACRAVLFRYRVSAPEAYQAPKTAAISSGCNRSVFTSRSRVGRSISIQASSTTATISRYSVPENR